MDRDKANKTASAKNEQDSAREIKKSVAEKIIAATCSKALQDVLKDKSASISDFDLLALAYRYAPDFRARLQLLQLVEINAESHASNQAVRCIAYERAKLERFSLFEKDCVFEVCLCSAAPSASACKLFARTFDGAIRAAENYFHSCGIPIKENVRFTLMKRRLFGDSDNLTKDRFNNQDDITDRDNIVNRKEFSDLEGIAYYKGDFVLIMVSHKKLCDNTVIASDMACFDRNCKGCECRPCLLHYAPNLPNPFAHFDLVYYTDRTGERHFCLVLDIKTEQSDECAYLIPLRTAPHFADKDEFLHFLEDEHIQIEFPLLEFADLSMLPPDIKRNLFVFKKQYKRFCEQSVFAD